MLSECYLTVLCPDGPGTSGGPGGPSCHGFSGNLKVLQVHGGYIPVHGGYIPVNGDYIPDYGGYVHRGSS